ncbi:alpha-1,2-fucosyltransferase [Sideroxydans lithotrophicus]|uniref:Glycosyl transferase family 11 n=1 Tax=Sideroxydans lithotrophicus (strain ES-1) TaxID=580332 RepID=D5CQ93_SIDLE|nr:alpha-1,2-fucosyltransferase [Sideroxydans lithotrophicus]ADE13114.1 glycosyl transferase family 11 [Sideroxydans lithotrophicus ES-1]
MVISNIIGGLGNQMFQYAAARALSLKLEVPLKLDISGFTNYALHQGFELDRIFGCKIEIASEADVHEILGWQSASGIRRVVSRPGMSIFRRKGFVVEPHFSYWNGIRKITGDCYLAGYWQSEKYFLDAAVEIRKDFSFKLPLDSHNAELAEKIDQENAVSLHIRRGDYANNPLTAATHGLCSLDYYRKSIKHIAGQVRNPYFFVFSDDIAWVKDNLEIEFPSQYVDYNHGSMSFNDMRLMSLCKHHIIANSSFSWWGAWLNPNPEKVVIAPERWFANRTDVQDLLPPGWVKL